MFSQAVVNKGRDGGGKEGRKRHLSTMTTDNLLAVRARDISEVIDVLLHHVMGGRNDKLDPSSFQTDLIHFSTHPASFSLLWSLM